MIAYPNGRWTSKNFGASGALVSRVGDNPRPHGSALQQGLDTHSGGAIQDAANVAKQEAGTAGHRTCNRELLAPDPLSPLKNLTELVRPILWPAEKVVEG